MGFHTWVYLAGIGRFRARTETEYQFFPYVFFVTKAIDFNFFPYVIWVHEQAVSNDTHTLWAYFGFQKWMTLFEGVSWMAGWVAAGLGWRLDVKYTS